MWGLAWRWDVTWRTMWESAQITFAVLLIAGLAAVVWAVVWANVRVLHEEYAKKHETRTIQSFKLQMFLVHYTHSGIREPVEGWLVTLSDGSNLTLKRLYNESGKVRIYTPRIGESIWSPLREKNLNLVFAEIVETPAQ